MACVRIEGENTEEFDVKIDDNICINFATFNIASTFIDSRARFARHTRRPCQTGTHQVQFLAEWTYV